MKPGDTIDDVIAGNVTLVSTVPDTYTQVTTCTHTSSGTETPCSDSCTKTTCNFKVNGANDGDKIEIQILLDGFDAIKAYGYIIDVKGKLL